MMSFEEYQQILCAMTIAMTHEEQLQAYDKYVEGLTLGADVCNQ